jgi:hypothetical protein
MKAISWLRNYRSCTGENPAFISTYRCFNLNNLRFVLLRTTEYHSDNFILAVFVFRGQLNCEVLRKARGQKGRPALWSQHIRDDETELRLSACSLEPIPSVRTFRGVY